MAHKKFTREGLPIITEEIIKELHKDFDERLFEEWCTTIKIENPFLPGVFYTIRDGYSKDELKAPCLFDLISSYMLLHNQGEKYTLEGEVWNGLPRITEETYNEYITALEKYSSDKLMRKYISMAHHIKDENLFYYSYVGSRSEDPIYVAHKSSPRIFIDLLNIYWLLRLQGTKDIQNN
jgi:hypothetical protein